MTPEKKRSRRQLMLPESAGSHPSSRLVSHHIVTTSLCGTFQLTSAHASAHSSLGLDFDCFFRSDVDRMIDSVSRSTDSAFIWNYSRNVLLGEDYSVNHEDTATLSVHGSKNRTGVKNANFRHHASLGPRQKSMVPLTSAKVPSSKIESKIGLAIRKNVFGGSALPK
jgi:hypothetical protein